MNPPLYAIGEQVNVLTPTGRVRDIVVDHEYLRLGDIHKSPTGRYMAKKEGYFYRVIHADNDGLRLWHEQRLRKLPDASDYDFNNLVETLNRRIDTRA